MEQENSRIKTIAEGAKLLRVSRFALYRKIKEGKLPAYHFGRKVLIDVDEVLQAMRSSNER